MSTPLHYIALMAPDRIDDQVRRHKLFMLEKFQCRAALKSAAHITLVPPFHLKEEESFQIRSMLDRIAAAQFPFDISLNGYDHFGKRVIFIKVIAPAQLVALQEQLAYSIQQIVPGINTNSSRAFHPHITIANRDLKPGDFGAAWDYCMQHPLHDSFRSDAIHLLQLKQSRWEIIHSSAFSQSQTNSFPKEG
jgi:2'-5' RNA ligase